MTAAVWTPLNVPLYANLKRVLGDVHVMHPGYRNVERGYLEERSFDGTMRRKLKIPWAGETYAVCCPFCKSAPEKSLYVNHTYMTHDGTRTRYWLAQCFRRYRCLDNRDNREAFWNLLQIPAGVVPTDRLLRGREPTNEILEPWWPDYCEPINELPPSHYARLYLAERRFDPDFLYERFRVHFCIESVHGVARRRLIIPFYADGRFVGWQGRVAAELPWKDPAAKKGLPPKYTNMTGFRKSLYCYNLDSAKAYKTIVVCEGVTGVWRHGDYAAAVQGMSPSDMQLKRLAAAAGRKGLVVWLLDPGAKEQAKAAEASGRLGAAGFRSCVVALPEGFDSGDLDADLQREVIAAQALKQGFAVDWTMKETPRAPAAV